MKTEFKKRINWIDAAKAIAIVLIVMGHTLREGVVHNMVYYVHIPVFFFLSGMTAKAQFSWKRIYADAKRLLIPYFVFGIISIAVYSVVGKVAASQLDVSYSSSLLENIGELLWGQCRANRPLWFLPSLFATKFLYYLVSFIPKGKKIACAILAIGGAIASFFYANMGLGQMPFSVELVLRLFVFFFLGTVFAPLLCDIEDRMKRPIIVILGGFFLIATFAVAAFLPPVNYTSNTFPAPILFYLTAFVGCISLSAVSMGLQNIGWIRKLGRRSLAVLVMHKFPIVFFQVFGSFEVLLSNPNTVSGFFFAGIPVTVISIILCVLAGKIIGMVCPIVLGDLPKRANSNEQEKLSNNQRL